MDEIMLRIDQDGSGEVDFKVCSELNYFCLYLNYEHE